MGNILSKSMFPGNFPIFHEFSKINTLCVRITSTTILSTQRDSFELYFLSVRLPILGFKNPVTCGMLQDHTWISTSPTNYHKSFLPITSDKTPQICVKNFPLTFHNHRSSLGLNVLLKKDPIPVTLTSLRWPWITA